MSIKDSYISFDIDEFDEPLTTSDNGGGLCFLINNELINPYSKLGSLVKFNPSILTGVTKTWS